MSGRYAVGLVVAHVVLIVAGYAAQERQGLVAQAGSVVTTYPEMGKAAVGTLLVLLVGAVSAGAVRSRLRYETWYYLHLLTYLSVYLGFWHQLATGAQFGATSVCLNGSGDVQVFGGPWRVGITDPLRPGGLAAVVVSEGALGVATSGPAERGCHIVDPHTGVPPVAGLASLTVLAPNLTEADAWGHGGVRNG
jgi:ApbE family/Ferric reductase like transmembrane component